VPGGKRQTPRPQHHARPVSQIHGFKERQDSLRWNDAMRCHGLSRAEMGTIVHLNEGATWPLLPPHSGPQTMSAPEPAFPQTIRSGNVPD